MSQSRTDRDQALEQLTSEFARVPTRVVLAVFLSYLDVSKNVSVATQAARDRLVDACRTA